MAECCTGGVKLIYSCSGCSDVGQIADLVSRKLAKEGFGKMTCLAALGAHLSGFVESAKGAEINITIDGCPVACARKTLEHIGVTPTSFILTQMGLKKGSVPVEEETVAVICGKVRGDKSINKGKGHEGSCCCSS